MKIVKKSLDIKWLVLVATCFSTPVFAAGPPEPNTLENPLALVLVIVMACLAIAIAILTSVVNGAASLFRDKLRAKKEAAKKSSQPVAAALLLVTITLLSLTAQAQTAAPAPTVSESINGLSPLTFYAMISVLAIEILVIIALIFILKWLIGIEKQPVAVAEVETVPLRTKINTIWNKMNRSIAIEREKDIDLNHDYDGIRELDNSIPPWWLFGFVFFIVFGFGYLYRYHVAKSAPLQVEELQIAMEKAEVEKAAYLKLTANNVDENNVKLLDEGGIAAGQALFVQNCAACHANDGGGSVGPNLTDNYWLHGGEIKDIFKTIKYGWPDKGMRSWKEDFSPVQIAELASFVKSLAGTKPATPKEPQGELLNAGGNTAAQDSTANGTQANLK